MNVRAEIEALLDSPEFRSELVRAAVKALGPSGCGKAMAEVDLQHYRVVSYAAGGMSSRKSLTRDRGRVT